MLFISTALFVEIITAEEGVSLEYQDTVYGININHYKGKSGKTVQINMSVENMSNRTAVSLMSQLGLDDLIIGLFPRDEQGNH